MGWGEGNQGVGWGRLPDDQDWGRTWRRTGGLGLMKLCFTASCGQGSKGRDRRQARLGHRIVACRSRTVSAAHRSRSRAIRTAFDQASSEARQAARPGAASGQHRGSIGAAPGQHRGSIDQPAAFVIGPPFEPEGSTLSNAPSRGSRRSSRSRSPASQLPVRPCSCRTRPCDPIASSGCRVSWADGSLVARVSTSTHCAEGRLSRSAQADHRPWACRAPLGNPGAGLTPRAVTQAKLPGLTLNI